MPDDSVFVAGVHALDRGGGFAGPVDVSVTGGRVAGVGRSLRPARPAVTGTVSWPAGGRTARSILRLFADRRDRLGLTMIIFGADPRE